MTKGNLLALRRLISLALLFCLLVASCASGPEVLSGSLSSPTRCIPAFPDRDGWYGGDGAYSIRLDDRRVLWLFGDTFVAKQEGRRDRRGMKVVLGTTLAISTCTAESGFRIRYFLKRKNGEFVSSFGNGEWLWPQDPFLAGGTLYVPLVSIQSRPEMEGPFKFEVAGHKIARIRDFSGPDPNRWTHDLLDLTPGVLPGIKAFAATSAVFRDHVYFYPLYGLDAGEVVVLGNILARIPVDRLDDPARAVEYWTRAGRWEKDPDPANVKVVLDAAASEMSVRHHPEIGKWVAVHLSLQNRGDRMLYQTAEAPEGPWSDPVILLGPIPEVDRKSPLYDQNNFCYAGKEQREFTRGDNLIVTYVCNSFQDYESDASFIRNNLFLYRPVVNQVRRTNPPVRAGPDGSHRGTGPHP